MSEPYLVEMLDEMYNCLYARLYCMLCHKSLAAFILLHHAQTYKRHEPRKAYLVLLPDSQIVPGAAKVNSSAAVIYIST